MMLWLTPEQARELLEHACAEAPNEACGLLLGQGSSVLDVIQTRNEAPDPLTSFVVAPQDLFAVLKRADDEGLDLVGVYHSHPAGHPIPSERDIHEAYYPEAAQLIVGLGMSAPEIAAWRIDAGRVSRIKLFIQAARPLPSDIEAEKMSLAQRTAVIVAGIIAIAIVLITAISLLPPPELPT